MGVPLHPFVYSPAPPISSRGGKLRVLHGVALDELPGLLLPGGSVGAVLVGDAVGEGVVRQGLDEEAAEGAEDGGDLGAGLPVLGLEQAEADAAEGVVADVGVVDAGDELDGGRLEGVVAGQGEQDAEAAAVEGRRGRAGEHDVPRVQALGGRQGDGDAVWGVLGEVGVFLWWSMVSQWSVLWMGGGEGEGRERERGADLGDALGRHGGGGQFLGSEEAEMEEEEDEDKEESW